MEIHTQDFLKDLNFEPAKLSLKEYKYETGELQKKVTVVSDHHEIDRNSSNHQSRLRIRVDDQSSAGFSQDFGLQLMTRVLQVSVKLIVCIKIQKNLWWMNKRVLVV